MSEQDIAVRKHIVKPLPLTQVAEHVERLDIVTARLAGVAEVNKRGLLRIESKLEEHDRKLQAVSNKLDRVTTLLERLGWILMGGVVLMLLALVVNAVVTSI